MEIKSWKFRFIVCVKEESQLKKKNPFKKKSNNKQQIISFSAFSLARHPIFLNPWDASNMTPQAGGNSVAERMWHSGTLFRLSGKQTGGEPCREADNLS